MRCRDYPRLREKVWEEVLPCGLRVLALHKPDGFNYDFWRDICTIRVADRVQAAGVISVEHEWEVN